MLYKFLCSKKGFTLTELMFVATILSILTAIAVPVFGNILHKQRLNDCKNQREVISAAVHQAMYGMMDNGKRQEIIDFSKANSSRVKESDGKTYFILTQGSDCFTLGDLRGGYRPATIENYNKGCESGYYLKKKNLENVEFYKFLDNSEYETGQKIPVCPFADDSHEYSYYIFADGTVLCSCPECNEPD